MRLLQFHARGPVEIALETIKAWAAFDWSDDPFSVLGRDQVKGRWVDALLSGRKP